MLGGVTTTAPPPSAAATARLMRRAQAVARLRHPNLVRLLPLPGGAGLSPVVGDARRLADFTLPAGTFKRFDLEQVVRLLLDVLSGLAALHEVVTDGQAFVHGQVSPQNIYIDEHGTARLVPLLNRHSLPNAKLEDPSYAAPERLAGGAFDARADVFSVGVMLWEALAGKRLFPDASPAGVLARLSGAKPPAIRLAANVRWATPLCAIADRAIATELDARFASALDLSNAMASAAAQQLSNVDTDAWQEEAPTPVFQPRLHLAKLRASTPPPAVLTIGASEPAPVAQTVPPALKAEPEALAVARGERRGRGALWALATVSLGAAAVLFAPKMPISWRPFAAVTQLAPAVAAAPAPLAVLPPLVAVSAVARASASAIPSAVPTPVVAVSPASVSASVAPKPSPKRAATKPNANVKPRGGNNDYGI